MTQRVFLSISLILLLVGCSAGISDADIDATVNARVAGTLSAVLSDDDAPPPSESRPSPTGELIPDLPTAGSGPSIGGCPVFPADHIWNTPVSALPVHPNSEAYIASIGRDTGLHPDFGTVWEGEPIGIPYNIVDGSTTEAAQIEFYYPDESDPGPYPIPSDPIMEGGGDSHILLVDSAHCRLLEIYDADYQGGNRWEAGSGAVWDLNGYALRPEEWTSADAAGLPILPGLVRYEEVEAGEIRHALRFTAETTQQAYVWPARHFASDNSNSNVPPMGQRFRLKADFDLSPFSADVQVILRAMQIYGLILADNGSDWFISGVPDSRWDDEMLVDSFREIPGSAFEAVDVSSLMIDPNSGQAHQP